MFPGVRAYCLWGTQFKGGNWVTSRTRVVGSYGHDLQSGHRPSKYRSNVLASPRKREYPSAASSKGDGINSLFLLQCDDEWDMCSSVCLQWRTAILRCCRSNGWSTPGERDLAEEKKWKLAWNLDNDARPLPFYEFEHCFKPPGSSIAHLLGPS
jgi:hypothetical protein